MKYPKGGRTNVTLSPPAYKRLHALKRFYGSDFGEVIRKALPVYIDSLPDAEKAVVKQMARQAFEPEDE